MPTRVLHLSDLHFGRNDRPESIEALGRLIEEARPELVIASGDLTHRGLRSQHERAAAFLRRLELPLCDPRQPRHPVHVPEALHAARGRSSSGSGRRPSRSTARTTLIVAGLNSVRPWRHQSGRLRDDQLLARGRAVPATPGRRATGSSPSTTTCSAPLALAQEAGREAEPRPRRARRGGRRPRPRRPHPPEHVAERREFELATPGGEHAVVVSIAPGFGQPRPNRRGEARGLHVYEIEPRRAADPHLHLARGRLGAHGRAHVPARP